ncbi:Gfo/Idh/MocA family oxidoreductase [uncultured Sunxiuqinia sp.]|uniref:Gfo/Idh/MocA family protein n=1 Tax=uncultured Sunxiuqinia sp. TaxID=1573825 RepID=UPI0026347986|nr:Gfo/Idh/MocA family oxidoreductase [uncultured Sunxiuqinia sp.]
MTQKIKWGVLSTAKIALQKVIPALQKSQYCEVSAIASRTLEKASQAAHDLDIVKHYGSYEELLEDPEIEAIYNPLPNHMHVYWTMKALEAGKHVLCEKPIGMNTEEAQALAEALKNFANLKVMEAFMYRFHPQWEKVFELVKNGAIGEVKTMQSFFSYFNIDPQNIRNQADIGGGALMDIGCYCASFPRFIFEEEPVQVVGHMEFDPVMKTDHLTMGMLQFPSGKTASFTCSTQLIPFQQTNIFGDEGHICIQIPVNAPPDASTQITLRTREKTEAFTFPPVDQYTLQGDAFSQAILQNTTVPTPLTDAIGNMKVIDGLVESTQNRQWITLG